jgi:hypothetical protein
MFYSRKIIARLVNSSRVLAIGLVFYGQVDRKLLIFDISSLHFCATLRVLLMSSCEFKGIKQIQLRGRVAPRI